ncbi:MAG: peptide ABC transporter permease [Elusimicrobia bacterium]|nr:MAG: peptide ABC transporter permease [Elusimicrobiota bacterium]
MLTFIGRKFLAMIPTLFGVSILVFVIFNVVGDDPVYLYLGKNATAEDVEILRQSLGLDKPLWMQYLVSMKELLTFDLGYSMSSKQKITDMFIKGAGPSIALTLPALIMYSGISIILGLVCAFYRGTWVDKSIAVLATIGMSISYVAVMIFAQYFIAFMPIEKWGIELFPITGYETGFPDCIPYIILPNLITVFVALGYNTRFFRSIAVEEMNKDYIRTARAYGANTRTILFKHVLKNIMIPIIARVVVTLPFMITGSFLLEQFFVVPGLGYKLLHAIESADFKVVRTFTMLIATLVVITNAFADILNSMVDPRVKLS